MKTTDQRADELIEVLEIKFKKSKDWSEPRACTAWGTKTRQGLRAVINRIMLEDERGIE